MPYGVPKGAKNPHQGDHPIRGGKTTADNNYHPPRPPKQSGRGRGGGSSTPRDVSHLPIKFGPGMHRTMLHNSDSISGQPSRPFKGSISSYLVQPITSGDDKFDYGRTRFGFRFHWNPNQVKISTAMDATVDPNPTDIFSSLNVNPHQQQISFSLLLHRAQDMGESDRNMFYPAVTQAQLQQIYNRGTLIDIEYIFRSVNGGLVARDNGYYTSDIGFFAGNILQVSMSPKWQFTGFINNLDVTHLQFTHDMIPIHSQVDFTMIRVSSTTNDVGGNSTVDGSSYLDTLPVSGDSRPPSGQGRDEGTRTTPLVQPPKPAPISRSKTRPI